MSQPNDRTKSARRHWSIDPDPGRWYVAPRQPRWDHPMRSPSVWVFSAVVVVIVLVTYAALEFAEWLFP